MTPPSKGRTRAIEIHDRMDVGNRDHQKTEHNLAILQEMAERAEAAERERDELKQINSGLCRDHNALLVDGARWQTRAETAEAQLTEAERAQQALRAEIEEQRVAAYRQMRIWEPNMDAYTAAVSVYEAAFGLTGSPSDPGGDR